MISLGKMKRITDLRKVWPNEAADFTPWLAREENLAELGRAIGMELELTEQESPVGNFSLDIFASEPGTGRKVVIENQLEPSNHDHLGKLITYASGKEAQVVVWIVKRARDEHSQAIEWLNRHTDSSVDFFLIEIELWQIGDSAIAPRFNIIERPNEWGRVQKESGELTGAKRLQLNFWQYFADKAFENDDEFARTFSKRKARPQHWYDLSVGSSACLVTMRLNTKENTIQAGAYVRDDKELFERFRKEGSRFEEAVKGRVEWKSMDKDCRFLVTKTGCRIGEQTHWPEYVSWLKTIALETRKFLHSVTKD